MKKIKILAVFFSTLLSVYATNSGFDNLTIGGTLQSETVVFTIKNNGTSPVTFKYDLIVIQDNVLMSIGETSLNPGEIKTIQVDRDSSGTNIYRLEVRESVNSIETGTVQTYSIQG